VTELFTWTTAQFGLAVGLLVVAVIILWRMLVASNRDALAQRDKRIAELEIERDLYRDRWVETIGAAEVGDELAKRAIRGRRRAGGS
jgi:hypothetical protein